MIRHVPAHPLGRQPRIQDRSGRRIGLVGRNVECRRTGNGCTDTSRWSAMTRHRSIEMPPMNSTIIAMISTMIGAENPPSLRRKSPTGHLNAAVVVDPLEM